MSKRYKIIFAIRFAGYFLFFTGFVSIIFLLGPLIQAELKYRTDRTLGVKRTVAAIPESTPAPDGSTPTPTESFANIKASENEIVPVSTEFGIVIEKING